MPLLAGDELNYRDVDSRADAGHGLRCLLGPEGSEATRVESPRSRRG